MRAGGGTGVPMRLKAFAAFMLATSLVLAGLGTWQWGRRAEKRAFLDAIAAGAAAAPKDLAAAALWDRVTLTGRFLHDKAAYVRSSRPERTPAAGDLPGKAGPGGFGVFVLTPFLTRICPAPERCTLATIYVDRGFVPTPPDGKIPPFDRPEDPVAITGFLRPSESPGLFQPGNAPARGVYFTRAVEEMAVAAGLFGAGETPPRYDRFVDREATPGEAAPFGLDAAALRAAIPNNHLQYAITWWALAVTNLVVALLFLARRRTGSEAR